LAELKRYSGRSLEEAMGKVNEALGPGAEILEAKRVRRGGVLGVMKRDVVEVVAKPRPARAPAASPGTRAERPSPVERAAANARRASVDRTPQPAPRAARAMRTEPRIEDFADQLHSLIDEVDLREDRQLLQRAAPPAPATAGSGRRFTDDDLAPLSDEPAPRRAARITASAASAATATAAARATASASARREAGTTPRPRTATRTAASTAPRQAAPVRRSGARNPGRPYAPAAALATSDELAEADERMMHGAAFGSAPSSAPAPVDHAPVRAAQPGAGTQTIDLRERRYGPSWSEEALRDLGLPDVVLDLMPMAVLRTDLEWTVALEAAIRAIVPAPTMPVAMCGYGPQSAVKILESMLGGCAMGEMRLQDRSVMATPFELALAVRQCLSQ
jgi:hypothetical protein